MAVKKSLAAGFKAQMDQMDEIKLLAGLPPHPHVLQVTGAYLEENAVCSVSPFMAGGARLVSIELDFEFARVVTVIRFHSFTRVGVNNETMCVLWWHADVVLLAR